MSNDLNVRGVVVEDGETESRHRFDGGADKLNDMAAGPPDVSSAHGSRNFRTCVLGLEYIQVHGRDAGNSRAGEVNHIDPAATVEDRKPSRLFISCSFFIGNFFPAGSLSCAVYTCTRSA